MDAVVGLEETGIARRILLLDDRDLDVEMMRLSTTRSALKGSIHSA